MQRYSCVKFPPQISEDKKNRTYLGEKFLNSLTKILFTYLVMFKFLYTAVNQLESSKLKENAKDKKTNEFTCMHVCTRVWTWPATFILTVSISIIFLKKLFKDEIIFYTYYFIICLSTKAVFWIIQKQCHH